ncbi:hypothetical protein QE152_g25326 [Popillia japonica]|uniref:Uncharacterized protein n=1 Tax=Popillia japonica TaxID=7064 RepID=A0AAW1K2C2_POPJA
MSRGNKFLTQAELDYLAENLNLSESEDEYENLSDDSNYLLERDEVDEENDVENTENMPTTLAVSADNSSDEVKEMR